MELVVGMFYLLVFIGLYMLPTLVAIHYKHPNIFAIGALNVLLGWSLIGWAIAMIWAFKK